MNTMDVVIISDAKTEALHQMTLNAIATCRQSEIDVALNIIVVETQPVDYEGCTTIHPSERFNYNKYLNIGASHGTAEYIAFCNNDLVFGSHWASRIIQEMTRRGVYSASPICERTAKEYGVKPHNGVIHGLQVRKLFCGWCFVWKRTLFNMIKHDEDFHFWCADNSTAEMMAARKMRHMLVCNSIVDHIQSATLNTLNEQQQWDVTFEQARKYNKKFGRKLFPHILKD
jgi:hypothetical protein